MADVHILAGNRVVMHIPVPSANNSVGINWRACLAASGNTTSMTEGTAAWEITSAEKALIEAGEIVESVATIRLDLFTGTLAEKNTQLFAKVDKIIPSILSKLQNKYLYFGHNGSNE